MVTTFVEYSFKTNGFFVLQTIPVGTAITGNKITLPEGKVIAITEEEEFELRYQLEQQLENLKAGQPLRPGEIHWSKLTSATKITEISWLRLTLFALVAPLLAWLFVEVTVLIVAWVRRGFSDKQRDS